MEAKLSIRKNAKCYYVRLTWYETNGKRRQTEVSTGILVVYKISWSESNCAIKCVTKQKIFNKDTITKNKKTS